MDHSHSITLWRRLMLLVLVIAGGAYRASQHVCALHPLHDATRRNPLASVMGLNLGGPKLE